MPEETNGYFEMSSNPINIKKHNNGFEVQDGSPIRTPSPILGEHYTYEIIEEIANFLLERTKIRPKIGIICGSGLGHLANALTDATYFPYEDIPNFPVATVQGHAGKMVFGSLNGVEVMCMQGRFHFYEGYPLTKCSMPVRVMKVCGCKILFTTNAAGGLNTGYKIGDIMFIKDHINMMGFSGNNPLQGPNDPRFGPRFPPMNRAYDPQLIKIAEELSKEMGIERETHTGIYICLGGPSYETVSELRMWRMLGVDAVGMSTVHEVITARHCDLKVFAFSVITNSCITEYDSNGEANHEEVISAATKRQNILTEFVTRMVEKISATL